MLIVMNCSYILGERELVDVRTFSAYFFFLLPASVVLHLVLHLQLQLKNVNAQQFSCENVCIHNTPLYMNLRADES